MPDEPTADERPEVSHDASDDRPTEDASPSDPPPPGDAGRPGTDRPPPSDPPPPGDAGRPGTDRPPPSDPPPPGDAGRAGGGAVPWPSIGGRRLYRRADDRVIAGVASGLGDFFGVDPAIIRLAFVCLAIFGGSGFVLYLLGWVFLPVRGSGTSVGEGLVRRVGGGRSAGGLVLIIVATLIILDSMQFFGGGLLWAALLIGIGVLLFRSDGDGDRDGGEPNDRATESVAARAPSTAGGSRSGRPTTTATAPSAAVGSTTTTIPPEVYDELPPPPPGLYDDWRPTPQPPPPEPPPPPSILGRVTVAAALILIGAVALLENLTGLDVSIAGYVALALTTVGVGLLVGARWGRARGLIALGAVLLLTLAAVSFTPRIPTSGFGQRSYTPQTVADLQQPYDLGAGQLVLDLTELQLRPSQRVEVQATMGVGSLEVIVPDGVAVEGEAVTRAGTISALDRTREGTDARVTFSEPGDEGSPIIALDVQNGFGEIKVRRTPAEVN